ncbi:MAG: right-handed parallel beta-helix repeat-containing protein [Actinomycetota bacterium]|nr:right-handed parallel beta-helix repeat-containing protein [Actinomycetota bacterium]
MEGVSAEATAVALPSRTYQFSALGTVLLTALLAIPAPVVAARLVTLRPAGPAPNPGGCVNERGWRGRLWNRLDDNPSSPRARDYVANRKNKPAACYVALSSVPANLDAMSSVVLAAHLRPVAFKDDHAALWAQLWNAARTRSLTRPARIGSHASRGRVSIPLRLTSVSQSRPHWQGALLRLSWTYKAVGSRSCLRCARDGARLRLNAIALKASYESAAPAPANPESSVGHAEVMRGIRPRGQTCSSYALLTPTQGAREIFVAVNGDDAGDGSAVAPLRSISEAARRATAGDVVTIRDGTYDEAVRVPGYGSSASPIVFQAENCGKVLLTGGSNSFMPQEWAGDWAGGQVVNPHVTVRGFVFHAYATDRPADCRVCDKGPTAIRASTGWRIEDVLLDHPGTIGINIGGHGVIITDTTIQFAGRDAFFGFGYCDVCSDPAKTEGKLRGLQIKDSVLRGNNQERFTTSGQTAEASNKLLRTYGAVIDNVESFENLGPGLWLDASNAGFRIRNSYFHDNRGVNEDWEGFGVNLECDSSFGVVENNVFHNNSGAALGLTESRAVEVTNNLFNSGMGQIELRSAEWGCMKTSGHRIHGNKFNDWAGTVYYLTATELASSSPQRDAIAVDQNTYDPLRSDHYFHWKAYDSHSLTALRSAMGYESGGSVAPLAWPPN